MAVAEAVASSSSAPIGTYMLLLHRVRVCKCVHTGHTGHTQWHCFSIVMRWIIHLIIMNENKSGKSKCDPLCGTVRWLGYTINNAHTLTTHTVWDQFVRHMESQQYNEIKSEKKNLWKRWEWRRREREREMTADAHWIENESNLRPSWTYLLCVHCARAVCRVETNLKSHSLKKMNNC